MKANSFSAKTEAKGKCNVKCNVQEEGRNQFCRVWERKIQIMERQMKLWACWESYRFMKPVEMFWGVEGKEDVCFSHCLN